MWCYDSLDHQNQTYSMAAEIMKTTMTIVFIPLPIMSHHAAAVQLANLLVDRDHRLSVTFIVMKLPIDTKTASHSSKNNNPRINFVELPRDDSSFARFSKSAHYFLANYVGSQAGPVRDAVRKINEGPARLAGFVVDMFCTPFVDVANELGLPSYIFFPCSAATLGLFFHLQGLNDYRDRDLAEYENSDVEISFPTYVNPVPAKVWPSIVFDKDIDIFDFTNKFRETKGIVVNTFLELEPHAIRSLSGDGNIPPVYPVGPMIQARGVDNDEESIIEWLDGQPDLSVVFVCFGSKGSFERDQVAEIALALENSGHGFLWSLRKPSPKEKLDFPGEYENLRDVLPDGFLGRTVGTGRVVGWTPQVAVLSHRAVGGFVSHCGWNSTLESVWCNVPMATWPLAAEQQANAFQVVRELGIGVDIKMDYRKDGNEIVAAEKIEKAIRELMDPGNVDPRAKMRALSEKSHGVVMEGGSSFDFLGRFIDDVLTCNVP